MRRLFATCAWLSDVSRRMHLSDKGLFDSSNALVPCVTEADVFAAMGVPYLEPSERFVCPLLAPKGSPPRVSPGRGHSVPPDAQSSDTASDSA